MYSPGEVPPASYCRPQHVVQAALPSAPSADQQPVQNKAMWYTTIGRLLVHPSVSWFSRLLGASESTVLDGVALQMTEELCGLQMQLDRCVAVVHRTVSNCTPVSL